MRALPASFPPTLCVGWEAMGRMPNGMDTPTPTSDSVLITAKRLDSDEAFETIAEIDPPESESAVRAQLDRLVRANYPDAEFRSFAGGAATYLAPKLLVVAVYHSTTRSGGDGDSEDSQQQLFAA
jgi:hypothetical protein